LLKLKPRNWDQTLVGAGGSVGWFGAGDDCERGRAFSDVIEAEWIADVGQLSGIQLFFPLSRGYRGEAPGADGVEAAIWITPVGKAWSWKGGHRALAPGARLGSLSTQSSDRDAAFLCNIAHWREEHRKKYGRRSVRTADHVEVVPIMSVRADLQPGCALLITFVWN
jgi:hypothetical protein